MATIESILRGSRGLRRPARASFPTSVTSQTPFFPRNYFPLPVRDTSAIANALLARVGAGVLTPRPALHRSLSIYEDRRQWHPDAIRPARSLMESYPAMGERIVTVPPGSPRDRPWRRTIKSRPYPNAPMVSPSGPLPDWWPESPLRHWSNPRVLDQFRLAPIQYGFMNPRKVVICLKRKIRREIAHALGFAGSPHNKKPRYNFYSYVRC